jgi:hypothetical protein
MQLGQPIQGSHPGESGSSVLDYLLHDQALNKMHKADRLEWAHRVSDSLSQVLRPGDSVVFLAGQKYRKFLEPSVLALSCQFSAPMEGMSIGKQLRWLGSSERS